MYSTVKNEIDGVLEMMEFQKGGIPGNYRKNIRVESRSDYKILSNEFRDRNRASLRPSEIVIYVDGTQFERSLLPEDFVEYSQLIFKLENKLLKVTGIPAKRNDGKEVLIFATTPCASASTSV